MRFTVIRASTARLLTKDDAGQYVGVPALLDKMVSAKWIKPAVSRRKILLFDVKALDQCCDRLALGDFPGEGDLG